MPARPDTPHAPHTIGHGTEVLGGVFHGRHAVVVDFAESPGPYEAAYERFEEVLPDASLASPLGVARNVVHAARQVVPFSPANARKVLRAEADARGVRRILERDEIGLSRFEGGGTCHHQALMAGALLNLLQERHGIGGETSVEWDLSGSLVVPSRHIWVRYTKDGQRIILDDSNPELAFVLERPVAPTDRAYLHPEETQELVDETLLDPDAVLET